VNKTRLGFIIAAAAAFFFGLLLLGNWGIIAAGLLAGASAAYIWRRARRIRLAVGLGALASLSWILSILIFLSDDGIELARRMAFSLHLPGGWFTLAILSSLPAFLFACFSVLLGFSITSLLRLQEKAGGSQS
jgi:hypothetical protein